MEEQILINYTKNEENFLLCVNTPDKKKTFTVETPELEEIINELKAIVERV